jgi:hypothetical protein
MKLRIETLMSLGVKSEQWFYDLTIVSRIKNKDFNLYLVELWPHLEYLFSQRV